MARVLYKKDGEVVHPTSCMGGNLSAVTAHGVMGCPLLSGVKMFTFLSQHLQPSQVCLIGYIILLRNGSYKYRD